MKKLFLTLTMLLFAFTGVMRASAEQGNVRADQVIEQGFEDGLGDWTMNHCHSSSGPTSSYGGNTGNYAFRFYYTTNYPQYLISPELDDNDGVNFTFYAARYSSNYPETFKVGYSSTTNDPTEFTWDSEVTCTTMYGAGAYQEYSYDFPAGTKYVSIACTSNDQFYMFVDDITVTATEPAPGGALTTTPDVLDLGYRPNGAWMAPYVFTINGTGTTVNALDFSGNYFTYNAELPATLTAAHPLEVTLTTGEAEEGPVNSTMTVLFGGNRDAAQFEITATAYDPEEGDVWENAIEVAEMEERVEYQTNLPATIYHNYELPQGSTSADAVYKLTLENEALLFAGVEYSQDGEVALYTEGFEGVGGPSVDNDYTYAGPTVNPGPTALWWYYDYTGTNTWYGTSAGGGFFYGYKISADVIAANELAGLTITQVEAAAREAYPYYCFIFEGGDTPFNGDLVSTGLIQNPTAMYFFDITLVDPVVLGDQDIWVIMYSESPYAGYCGRNPVDTNNGKIWTYNPNATSPMWSSNVAYTPVIYCHMLELPTGRETIMNLANMSMPKGNGVVSEIAEAEGDVMNVAKAQLRNRDTQTLTVHDGSATNGYVPVYGFYADAYLKAEFVYPAAELADMNGAAINSMTFYASQESVSWGAASYQVFVAEVADASISAFAGPGTVVYEGSLSVVGNQMVVNFNTPYTYNGGNLLVGVYETTTGSYVTSTWLGEAVDGASVQGYNYSGLTAVSPTQRNFLPKTTFAYDGEGGDTPEPPTPSYEPFVPTFTTQIDGMYVPAGTYYLVAASDVEEAVLSFAIADVPAPEPSIVLSPVDGETNVEAPYLAEWELGAYTTEMQVLVGTQYPPTTVLIDWTDYLVESAFIMDLEPNQSYFIQVNGRNAAGTTMSEIVAFTTPIDPVEGFAVENDQLYPGDAAVFTWEANRAFKGYNLYKDGVKVNETPITTNTYAVEGLEYNMEGYQFILTAVYDAGESLPTDPITVQMTGNGTVSGHVYDTDEDHPVAGLPVTLIVLDEYQMVQHFEYVTDENGFYTGEALAGMCIAGISEENGAAYGYAVAVYYDPNNVPYVMVAYEGVYENIDIYTHEYYYPLSQITATEEENDVLVEWSWTPAEMIVDFETGDFSQADFTLPATYPWAITTSNTHEGTYAIKSTCEGQASASSSVEATVDVPYDGKMGFWVSVSSESNYDKFHFYIDGVEQGSALSGTVAYTYKEYDVAEGTHTYKWEYTKDSSVNSGDDCAYVDDITMYRYVAPLPPVVGATTYDFEDGTMQGWTNIDANNDSYVWVMGSQIGGVYLVSGASLAGSGHNSSNDMVCSGSYSNATQSAITPDNFLVSPQISAENGAQIQFYACAQDASYAAEHFGVAVSTSGNTSAADFTTIQEWTMTAKGAQGKTAETEFDIRGTRDQGNWYLYTVDLSSYAGQDIYVAIRHFNCNDQFILNVDDITLATGGSKDETRGDRSLVSYNLYRRNNYDEASVENPTLLAEGLASDVYEYIDAEWPTLSFGEWQWGIQATYAGYANEPEATRDVLFTDSFEDGALTNWTTVDADGDGDTWQNATPASYGIGDAHSGTNCASSWSWNSFTMYPDNWMISPMVEGATSIQYYVATNTAYPDHYGIYASSTGTNTSDFTLVFEETAASKSGNGTRSSMTQAGTRAMSDWMEKNIDLPEGTKYVAFRHWNSDDMNYLFIDDVTINGGSTPPPTPPTPGPTGDGLSEILWSNVIEKGMEATLTFNITLNNGQSPAGAVIEIVGEDNEYTATATGATTTVEVRKAPAYEMNVTLDGYTSWTYAGPVEADATFDITLIEEVGPVEGLYVSPTGWVMWEGTAGGVTPGPGPGPQPGNNSFTEDFEGGLNGWNVLTVNADGGEWIHSDDNLGGYDYTTHAHGGTGFAMCYSFVDYVGSFNTDSYLYTAQKYAIENGSTLTFWADNANDQYPESFSVCVATVDNPTAADFTQVWSGSAKGTSKGGALVRHNNNRYDNWRSHNIDLSAYAGQEVYIAFHDVNYDMYEVWIDDVELGIANKGDRAPLKYVVKLDGVVDGETTFNGFQHNVEGMVEGSTHTTAVRPVFISGNGDWMEYTWTYTSCDNFAGVSDLAAAEQGSDVKLTWTMPGAPGPGPQPGGDTFTEDFEGGLNGWNVLTINADGGSWIHSNDNLGGYDYTELAHGGTGFAMCYSFVDYVGSFNTDSYMYTPQMYTISNGSALTFWADNANDSYPESFSVVISTAANPSSAADFTTVWSGSAKGTASDGAMVRHNNKRYNNWRSHTVDLSAYAGQTVYIGFHDVNYDMYEIWIDDVELGIANKGNRDAWDLVYNFSGTSAGQQAVATDGNYIYTASWQTTPTGGHTFYQYDLQGNFIEGFEIAGATGIRDLTTDGEYFYGTSGGAQIFCMDFTTRTLVSTINCSGLTSRHISYDPERDGFWSGNWSTLALYDRTGSVIQSGAAPSSAYGSAYYKDADGVEHLYLFCQPESDAKVFDYNIATNTISGPIFDFAATPGFNGIAGGCFIGNYDNKLCWFGNSQQDPNLIGIYELEGGSGPVPPTPVEGILGAMVFQNGEPIAFVEGNPTQYVVEGAAAYDATYGVRVVYGGEYDVTYYAMSCMDEVDYTGTVVPCNPVADLTAEEYTYNGNHGALVSWTEPAGATSYKIYVDGELLGSLTGQPVFINFEGSPAGNYTIGIVAVYAECESDMETVDFHWTPVSVDELSANTTIYPNPTHDNVTIEAKGMRHITVVSALGQVVYDADIEADMTQLNLGQFKAGLYVVRIDTENGTVVKRVSVVK